MVAKKDKHKERVYGGNDLLESIVNGNEELLSGLGQIVDILKKDYKNRRCIPFKGELAIDLDKVEIKLAAHKGCERNCTVDFFICLKNESLLLVEAKLDVDNVNNISKSIKSKIDYSRSIILSKLIYNRIDAEVIVLLKDERFHERSNRLKKLVSNNLNITPSRLNDFYEKFFKGA